MSILTPVIIPARVGKLIHGDLYVHLNYIDEFNENQIVSDLINSAKKIISADDLECCNVIKINLDKCKLSFLQYFDFENDPFPTLNGSWAIDLAKKRVSFRSYSSSLNPPILHRKELLVSHSHPKRKIWEATTKTAEDLGLFASSSPIGFKENWLRLILEKGFRLEGQNFVPFGNQINDLQTTSPNLEASKVQRHLTALSRSTLSAPVQLLIGHGLISAQVTVFDYGCGRGDDIKGLESIDIRCSGWDPHYHKENTIKKADIVNLGFVVNVIEDPAERVEAIERAFCLAGTALVASVMLHSNDRPGKPYRDGYLTARNTFQKYFSQDEFKDYLEHVLNQEPVMIGPGIALVFKDKDAEQRFLLNRYRSSNVARRLLSARVSPRSSIKTQGDRIRAPRKSRTEREFEELRPMLDEVWRVALEMGRFPEQYEIPQTTALPGNVTHTRAIRLIRAHYDLGLLEKSADTRSNEIKLYIASLQFGKKAPYSHLEPKLRNDIRYFFGDYKAATNEALRLLLDSGKIGVILEACKQAAADGLGWLDDELSLQIHTSLVERLPAVLRAYISCGLLLWNNMSAVQLIKIHIGSGKLTLLKYDNFEDHAIPDLVKRVKVNIRKLDYDVFDYDVPQHPPSPLLLKSRFMHEDMPGYAEQAQFDEALELTGIFDQLPTQATRELIDAALEAKRLEIDGVKLVRSSKIPHLDQPCGMNLTFRDLIECGETQAKFSVSNRPLNPATYNALHDLCSKILDPVIEYFGAIRLTYGFSSPALALKIDGRISPKLDQHSSHEFNRLGKPVCDRLGAAVDFIVEDENMLEVAQWIVKNTTFDRLYFYGAGRPIHVSFSEFPVCQVTLMIKNQSGKQVPKTVAIDKFIDMT